MKRVLIYSALALVCGAAILRLLQHDAGYVLIAIAGKTIEMRFWFAVLFVVGFGLLLAWLIRFSISGVRAVSGGWSLALASRARRGAKHTESGLIHFIEGDWQAAQLSLLKAAKDVDTPFVHYLASARSAYEIGDFDKAEALIGKAQKTSPDKHLSIAISQAHMLFLKGSYEACLSVLHGIKTSEPNHPVVLSLLVKAYLAVDDWASLETLLPSLERKKTFPEAELVDLQKNVYCHLLMQVSQYGTQKLLNGVVSQNAETENFAVLDSQSPMDQVWSRLPKTIKQFPEVTLIYSKLLLASSRFDEAEVLLRTTLKKTWFESLVELYGLLKPLDVKLQLRTAELWLKSYPQSAILQLALGRICLRNQLWGQAKAHFQSSLKLQANPTIYAELARLQSAMGEHEQSLQSYRSGLLLASQCLPDVPLPHSL